MHIPCIWCGRDLNVGGRVTLMRELTRGELPAVDPQAVVPIHPPPSHLQMTVSCVHCRSTVAVPADYPEASA